MTDAHHISDPLGASRPGLWARIRAMLPGGRAAEVGAGRHPRGSHAIVPSATVTGGALVAVVAIMTFLAGITIGSVAAVRSVASEWTADIARETTIQIKPGGGLDVEAALAKAVGVAKATPGIAEARALDAKETARLLEPWLGSGLDLSSLPVPRLVVVTLAPTAGPDTAEALRAALAEQVPSASFDDHRQWTQRLSSTARAVVAIGLAVLALVAAATVLCVVFATRAAVDAARSIVEVLHFVGARDGFIAAEFQHHFLAVGLKGGVLGGGAAMAVFFLASTLPHWIGSGTPADTLLGAMTLDLRGYGGILGASVLVALVTAVTSRITVYRTLRGIS
ncbi:cell division protein [Ancylobacter sonchi]|uniref:cell division protein FtsX n=1 Tax=Ancylobacter sonchi TaxID=1937790 RepID=UPI001BD5E480|nr:cell division protein [Ancylobacter sonchi]MBS7533882.1 cell division protein [Ancylobacter sonchi]